MTSYISRGPLSLKRALSLTFWKRFSNEHGTWLTDGTNSARAEEVKMKSGAVHLIVERFAWCGNVSVLEDKLGLVSEYERGFEQLWKRAGQDFIELKLPCPISPAKLHPLFMRKRK